MKITKKDAERIGKLLERNGEGISNATVEFDDSWTQGGFKVTLGEKTLHVASDGNRRMIGRSTRMFSILESRLSKGDLTGGRGWHEDCVEKLKLHFQEEATR